MYSVIRYHDISCGHRVYGHESKCAHLHGHNYRIHFECTAKGLDALGRVIDFSCIKAMLCEWLETNWDHRMLIWDEDPCLPFLKKHDSAVVSVSFNPTAENIAWYLVEVVGPEQLDGTGVTLRSCTVQETAK